MPKFLVTEYCNELRVYYYEVDAETREAANTLYLNGDLPPASDSRLKDVLYTEHEILELP